MEGKLSSPSSREVPAETSAAAAAAAAAETSAAAAAAAAHSSGDYGGGSGTPKADASLSTPSGRKNSPKHRSNQRDRHHRSPKTRSSLSTPRRSKTKRGHHHLQKQHTKSLRKQHGTSSVASTGDMAEELRMLERALQHELHSVASLGELLKEETPAPATAVAEQKQSAMPVTPKGRTSQPTQPSVIESKGAQGGVESPNHCARKGGVNAPASGAFLGAAKSTSNSDVEAFAAREEILKVLSVCTGNLSKLSRALNTLRAKASAYHTITASASPEKTGKSAARSDQVAGSPTPSVATAWNTPLSERGQPANLLIDRSLPSTPPRGSKTPSSLVRPGSEHKLVEAKVKESKIRESKLNRDSSPSLASSPSASDRLTATPQQSHSSSSLNGTALQAAAAKVSHFTVASENASTTAKCGRPKTRQPAEKAAIGAANTYPDGRMETNDHRDTGATGATVPLVDSKEHLRKNDLNFSTHGPPQKTNSQVYGEPGSRKSAPARSGPPPALWQGDHNNDSNGSDDEEADDESNEESKSVADFPEIELPKSDQTPAETRRWREKERRRRQRHLNQCCVRYAKNWADTLLPLVVLVAYVLSVLLIKSTLLFVQHEITTAHVKFQAFSTVRSPTPLRSGVVANKFVAACADTQQCGIGTSLTDVTSAIASSDIMSTTPSPNRSSTAGVFTDQVDQVSLFEAGRLLADVANTVNATSLVFVEITPTDSGGDNVASGRAIAWFRDSFGAEAVAALDIAVPTSLSSFTTGSSECTSTHNVTWLELSSPSRSIQQQQDCALWQRVSALVRAASSSPSPLSSSSNRFGFSAETSAVVVMNSTTSVAPTSWDGPASLVVAQLLRPGMVIMTGFPMALVAADLQSTDPNATVAFGVANGSVPLQELLGAAGTEMVDPNLRSVGWVNAEDADNLFVVVNSDTSLNIASGVQNEGPSRMYTEDPFAYRLSSSSTLGSSTPILAPVDVDGRQWCVTIEPAEGDGLTEERLLQLLPNQMMYCTTYPEATLLALELFVGDVICMVVACFVCVGLVAITWAPRPKLPSTKNWKVLRLHVTKLREQHRSMSSRRSMYLLGASVMVLIIVCQIGLQFYAHFSRTSAMEASFVKHVERASIVNVEAFFTTAELGLELYAVSMGSNTVLSAANFSAQVLDDMEMFGALMTTPPSAALSSSTIEFRKFVSGAADGGAMQRLQRSGATPADIAWSSEPWATKYTTAVAARAAVAKAAVMQSSQSMSFDSFEAMNSAGDKFFESATCLLSDSFTPDCTYNSSTGLCPYNLSSPTVVCPYSLAAEPFVTHARKGTNWSGLVSGTEALLASSGLTSPDAFAAYFTVGGRDRNVTQDTQSTFTHTALVDISRVQHWLGGGAFQANFSELFAVFLTAGAMEDSGYLSSPDGGNVLLAEATSSANDPFGEDRALVAYVGTQVNVSDLVAQAEAKNLSEYIDDLAQIYTISTRLPSQNSQGSGSVPWAEMVLTTAFRAIDVTYSTYLDVTGMHCMLIFVICGIILINLNTGINREMAIVRKLLRRFENARSGIHSTGNGNTGGNTSEAFDRILNAIHNEEHLMLEMRRLLGGDAMLSTLGPRARRKLAKNILVSVAGGVRRQIVDIVARELYAAVRTGEEWYLWLYYAVTGNIFHVVSEGFILVHIVLIFLEPANATLHEYAVDAGAETVFMPNASAGTSLDATYASFSAVTDPIASRNNVLMVEAVCLLGEIACLVLKAACFGICCFHPRGLLHSAQANQFARRPANFLAKSSGSVKAHSAVLRERSKGATGARGISKWQCLSFVRTTPLAVAAMVLVGVSVVDWSFAVALGSNFRLFSRIARVLLLVLSRADLLAIVRVFVTTAQKVYSIILLLFVLVVVGAVMGTFLFGSTGSNTVLSIWADDFEDFTGTLLTMFTFLCTGENYPSVVVGRVNANPVSALFFIIASFLGVFLITGLLVGYFQEHFGKSLLERQTLARTRQFRFGCALSFLLLDTDDSNRLSREEFKFFVRDVMIPRRTANGKKLSPSSSSTSGCCQCTLRRRSSQVHASSSGTLAVTSVRSQRLTSADGPQKDGDKGDIELGQLKRRRMPVSEKSMRAVRPTSGDALIRRSPVSLHSFTKNEGGTHEVLPADASPVDDIEENEEEDSDVDDIALEDALIIDEVFDVISSSVGTGPAAVSHGGSGLGSPIASGEQSGAKDISFDDFSSILLLWRQYRRFYTIKGLLQGIKYFMRKEHDEYISQMSGSVAGNAPAIGFQTPERKSQPRAGNGKGSGEDSEDDHNFDDNALDGDDDLAIGKQNHRDSVFMDTTLMRSRAMLDFQNAVLTVTRSRAFQQISLVLSLYYTWCMAYLCVLSDERYRPMATAASSSLQSSVASRDSVTAVEDGLEFSLIAILILLALDIGCRIAALTFTNFWWHHNLNLRRTHRFETSLLILSAVGYAVARVALTYTTGQASLRNATLEEVSDSSGWLADLHVTEDAPLFFLAFMCFRILTQVQSLRHELVALERSFGQFASVLLLLLVVMLLYAIVAVEWFGGQFSAIYGDTADNHFDTMWLACCTFYQLMTGEDWDGVMTKAINAKGRVCALFFVSYMVIAMTIFANLFVGIVSERAAEFRSSVQRGDNKSLWELNYKSKFKHSDGHGARTSVGGSEVNGAGRGRVNSLVSIVRMTLRKKRRESEAAKVTSRTTTRQPSANTSVSSQFRNADDIRAALDFEAQADEGSGAGSPAIERTSPPVNHASSTVTPNLHGRTKKKLTRSVTLQRPQRRRNYASFGRLIRNVISVGGTRAKQPRPVSRVPSTATIGFKGSSHSREADNAADIVGADAYNNDKFSVAEDSDLDNDDHEMYNPGLLDTVYR